MPEDHIHALPSGYQLHEYRVESILGAGGFGITYLATDTQLNKIVAIKEYLPSEMAVRVSGQTVAPKSSSDNDDYSWGLTRFLDEARTLARFQHPNLNQVHRLFEANGTAYMVLDYVEGRTLSQILKEQGRLSEIVLKRLLREILSGLQAVHDAGFVHRDIKPGNIMLRNDGSSVLLDFGAARQAIGQRSKSLTSILTPGYAPVEQYDTRAEDVGPWSDMYALGMVAYRAVTGLGDSELPDAVTRSRYQKKGQTERDLTPAVEFCQGQYDPALLASIDLAIAVDEDQRPRDVGEWLRALDGATSGKTRNASQPSASNAGLIVAIVVAALLIMLLGAGGYWFWQQRAADALVRQQETAFLAELAACETLITTRPGEYIDSTYEAYACFEDILNNYPDMRNLAAVEQYRTDLKSREETALISAIETALSAENTASAERLLAHLRTLSPYHASLTSLENRLEELKRVNMTQVQSGDFDDLVSRGHTAYNAGNYAEAARLYRDASALGELDTTVQINLGALYYNGNGVARDYAEGVKWFRKAANRGDATAESWLGAAYENGNGVARNTNEAIRWYRKAANKGNDTAQVNLGSIYYNGAGVESDYDAAIDLFRKAANQGSATGQVWLGTCYYHGHGVSQSYSQAVDWFRKSAGQGNATAQYNLGDAYKNGYGVTKDLPEALKWYRKAAEQGIVSAYTELAYIYEKGNGVPQNYSEAVKWYRKAAAQDNVTALVNLGALYYNGQGVTRDYSEAVRLFRRAANQGDSNGDVWLGTAYYNGHGVGQSYSDAFTWFLKAAEKGNAVAQYNTANAYETGTGTSTNMSEARRWYRKAAAQGQTDATNALERLGN